jgi:folate-binding protein YgfZ
MINATISGSASGWPAPASAKADALVAPSVPSSPLLARPGAVAAGETAVDRGVAWHYGDPFGEQRRAVRAAALFDRSNRDVLAIAGSDRLSWLHSICSQHVSDLSDGQGAPSLVLSPNGHVEQQWTATELGGQIWLDTEPAASPEVLGYLLKMRFMKRVEPADITSQWAVLTLVGPSVPQILETAGLPAMPEMAYSAVPLAGGGFLRRMPDLVATTVDLIVPREAVKSDAPESDALQSDGPGAGNDLRAIAARLIDAGAAPSGTWAFEALRVEARQPRLRFETDHRTIPHEINLIGDSVHLDKGCYRGQETVARVHNLGKPPRRLVQLYLSGEDDVLPEAGTAVELDGRTVGFLGTAVQHHELGPIALAVIKRSLPDDAPLIVAGRSVAIAH